MPLKKNAIEKMPLEKNAIEKMPLGNISMGKKLPLEMNVLSKTCNWKKYK